MELQAPEKVKEVLNKLVDSFKVILGDNLVGIYIHGGITMGIFNPASSDLDVIAVVNTSIELETKKELEKAINVLSENLPAKGFEIDVVTRKSIDNFQYPAPREFYYHYSEGASLEGEKLWNTGLASDFINTKTRGVCLYGEPIAKVFSDSARPYYLKAIAGNAEWSYHNIQDGPDSGSCNVPTFGVLSFCRTLAFIETGLITSKKEGGEWALAHTPKEFSPIINAALKEYDQSGTSQPIDAGLLKRFASYSCGRIEPRVTSR